MHPIDEASPLYGLGLAEMIEHDMEIVVMMSGMDETIADRIYARHAYMAEEVLWRRRFVDVVSVMPGGCGCTGIDRRSKPMRGATSGSSCRPR